MLDTAGWVLYRQNDFAGAEPYLRSAYAVLPSFDMSLHLSAVLLKLGRMEEALKYFAAIASAQFQDAGAGHLADQLPLMQRVE